MHTLQVVKGMEECEKLSQEAKAAAEEARAELKKQKLALAAES